MATRKVMLYALSTCGWCKKARTFLDENKVSYRYVYVDKLEGEARDRVLTELRQWNASLSFPTVVVMKRS